MTNMEVILKALKDGAIVTQKDFGAIYKVLKDGTKKRYWGHTGSSGYLMICISHDGFRKECKAHRIIWMAEHGEIPEDLVINHKDFDKQNNAIDNLELVTRVENCRHYQRDERSGKFKGEGHHNAGLTGLKVKAIRRIFDICDFKQKAIGKIMGLSEETMSGIILRKTWKDI